MSWNLSHGFHQEGGVDVWKWMNRHGSGKNSLGDFEDRHDFFQLFYIVGSEMHNKNDSFKIWLKSHCFKLIERE